MPYDKKDAEQFLKRVIEKLDKSAQKYSDNAYLIADVTKEIDEEMLDAIGWPLLDVLRLREILKGKVLKIDEIYWDKFFPRQTDEFLEDLYNRVGVELDKRRNRK